ncbi:MAG: hypothetical protein FWB73_02680 [Treponema sp.]|nr:hypothetical protein [Treponema sp.]
MENFPVLLLLIYSAFTINLLLQCGLGIKGAVESKIEINISTISKICIIFITVIVLWLFFSKVVFALLPGLFIYILAFPVGFIVYDALEYFVFRYLIKKNVNSEDFINFPSGITSVSVFLCIMLANNFLQALVLSFGFTSGIFLITLVIREIRKRAALEAVPVFLRGKPLALVTMGMLSLVFATASLLLFGMIGIK